MKHLNIHRHLHVLTYDLHAHFCANRAVNEIKHTVISQHNLSNTKYCLEHSVIPQHTTVEHLILPERQRIPKHRLKHSVIPQHTTVEHQISPERQRYTTTYQCRTPNIASNTLLYHNIPLSNTKYCLEHSGIPQHTTVEQQILPETQCYTTTYQCRTPNIASNTLLYHNIPLSNTKYCLEHSVIPQHTTVEHQILPETQCYTTTYHCRTPNIAWNTAVYHNIPL